MSIYDYNNKKRNRKPIPSEIWLYIWLYILIPILNILFLLGIMLIN